MPKLLYISLMRLPTEKAHGLQIMQNCEAFADAGYEVTLWVARRWNIPEMRHIKDVYAYYGVQPNFRIERIPCLDLFPLVRRIQTDGIGSRIAFYVQLLTYILMLMIRLPLTQADIFYSRDETLLTVLRWFKARQKLAYEAHLYAQNGRGANLQRRILQHCASVIAITPRLRDDLITRGANPERIIVAHDGIRQARFTKMLDRQTARQQIGWDQDAFIVGFVGRLQMIGMEKGVGTLVTALIQVEGTSLALVGGPDSMAQALRQNWLAGGLPDSNFLYAGQVTPDQVPLYLSAFDVCAMPHPHTTQFAYYTSPLKLFEYMASHAAIVASDLPAWSDVLADEENALLVPASDVDALALAIKRLRDDSDLRQKLASAAYAKVIAQYTWSARANKILRHIESADS